MSKREFLMSNRQESITKEVFDSVRGQAAKQGHFKRKLKLQKQTEANEKRLQGLDDNNNEGHQILSQVTQKKFKLAGDVFDNNEVTFLSTAFNDTTTPMPTFNRAAPLNGTVPVTTSVPATECYLPPIYSDQEEIIYVDECTPAMAMGAEQLEDNTCEIGTAEIHGDHHYSVVSGAPNPSKYWRTPNTTENIFVDEHFWNEAERQEALEEDDDAESTTSDVAHAFDFENESQVEEFSEEDEAQILSKSVLEQCCSKIDIVALITNKIKQIERQNEKHATLTATYNQVMGTAQIDVADTNTPTLADNFANMFREGNFSTGQKALILETLQRMLPNAAVWPDLDAITRCENASEAMSNSIDDDGLANLRLLEMNICPKGCCVFVGDYESLVRCPVTSCRATRFRKCTRLSCEHRHYDECNCPFEYRIPRKNLYYRPIIALLYQLLGQPGFAASINNWQFIKPSAECADYRYMDFLDGTNAEKHLQEMHDIYLQHMDPATQTETPLEADCQEISLLTSLFYDGISMFKHSTTSYTPAMMTIQNLPPSYRSILGVGIFSIALFTSVQSSFAEKFLFRYCLYAELLALAKGLRLTVNGKPFFFAIAADFTRARYTSIQQVFGSGRTYFKSWVLALQRMSWRIRTRS